MIRELQYHIGVLFGLVIVDLFILMWAIKSFGLAGFIVVGFIELLMTPIIWLIIAQLMRGEAQKKGMMEI